MPLSPYFLQGSSSEQRLVQDLINEQLKIYGQDIVYLPRKVINKNTIIKEVTASTFDDAYRMEAYLLNYQGFEGNGDILQKFGVQTTDAVTFVISKERYEDFISPFLNADSEFSWDLKPDTFLLMILFSVTETNLKFFALLDDLISCCPILPRHPVIAKLIFFI